MGYEDLTIFLPFRGEFGHLIMWHAPNVNAHEGKKIVCCEHGQESLFSDVTEYIFVDPRPEDVKKTANAHSYDKKFFEELQDKHGKRFPGAKFVRPAGEFNESHPKKYVSYQPNKKYDIECDIVVCPRKRILAPDRNWEHWNALTKKLKAAGYAVCAAGSPTASYKTPCVKAWSYERFLDATIEAIQKSKLVICTDSGLAHLAVQCGKPILMITFNGQPGPKTKWQVKWNRYNLENHTNSPIKSIDAWNNLDLVFNTATSMIKNEGSPITKPIPLKKAINIGCGKDIRLNQDGYQWTNVDTRKICDKVEEVDVFGKLPYKDGEFDHVCARDILEHYSYRRTNDVLKEWARILKIGGNMFVQVPCLTTILQKFNKKEVNEDRLIELLYGGQNYPGNDWVFNSHYTCFSEAKLKQLFSEINMQVTVMKKKGNNLDVSAVKKG